MAPHGVTRASTIGNTIGNTIQGVVFRPKILVHAQDSCACTTLLCMHNTLVHALEGQGPKAGTQKKAATLGRTCGCFFVGSRPWYLAPPVHAQECCACTRVLCMHKNLVHAQQSCACTVYRLILHNHKSADPTSEHKSESKQRLYTEL